MGGACRAHGGDEKCKQYLLECLKERNHSEDLGVDATTTTTTTIWRYSPNRALASSLRFRILI
jgi:hypothetical protein